MAEIVQRRIEERIPELEQLERVGLFTQKEIRYAWTVLSFESSAWHDKIVVKDAMPYGSIVFYTKPGLFDACDLVSPMNALSKIDDRLM